MALPTVKGLLGNTQLADDVSRRCAQLMLLDGRHDLLRGTAFSLHGICPLSRV
jgi:hypothetical protein